MEINIFKFQHRSGTDADADANSIPNVNVLAPSSIWAKRNRAKEVKRGRHDALQGHCEAL
jgi:hypothetical protein